MKNEKIEIPEGWEEIELGKLANFTTGKKNVNEGNNEGIYPFYTCSKSISYSNNYSFDKEALMIAGNGDVGTIHYYSGKFEAYQRTYVLSEFNSNVKYIFQYLKNKLIPHLLKEQSGTTIQFIKIAQLTESKILLPKSITEQKKIAEILSKVDEAIEKTENLISKYEHIKTGLMQDLLTKGIDENGNIRSEETHEFKDSPLGRIPKEWEIIEIENIAKLKSGGTPSRQKKDFWNGNIPWVRTTEVNYENINETLEKITVKELNNSSATLFPKETILMAIYGEGKTRGRVAILNIEATTNQACVGFLDLNNISTYYLYYLLINEYNSLREVSNDGAQKNLSINMLNNYKIKIPINKKEQFLIENILLSNDKKIKSEKKQLQKLQRIKTALMQDLLSGKKRVTNLIKEEE